MLQIVIAFVAFAFLWPHTSAAQSRQGRFEVGGQFGGALSTEFDSTDLGFGARFSWHPVDFLGAEAELDFYPTDLADHPAFRRGRVEGLFGVTIGPRFGRLRPFARVRPGFVAFRETTQPFACILIYPPPLVCQIAGETVFALDVGAGVEFSVSGRTFVRVDAGDRAMRYPGPAFGTDRTIHDEAFFSHDFRFAFGAGVRF